MGLRRLPNLTYRSREHLTPAEVQQLIKVAELAGVVRDRTLMLLMFRHGLRLGKLVC